MKSRVKPKEAPVSSLTPSEKELLRRSQRPKPVFSDEELQALHYDQRRASYTPDKHYDARRSAIKKLDAYFGDSTGHLK